jgi:hypothetical protein
VTVNIYERKVEESKIESNTVSGIIGVHDLTIRAAHYGVRYPPHHLCNSNMGVSRHLSNISSSSSRINSNLIDRNPAAPKNKMIALAGIKGPGMVKSENASPLHKSAAPIESTGRHADIVRFLKSAYWDAGWALQTQTLK